MDKTEKTLADIELDGFAHNEWEAQPKFTWKSVAFKTGYKLGYKAAVRMNQEYIDGVFEQSNAELTRTNAQLDEMVTKYNELSKKYADLYSKYYGK